MSVPEPLLLDRVLSAGAGAAEAGPVEIDFARLSTGERSRLAELLAGTADRKSREYKSARRQVERWGKGAKPKPASTRRLAGAQRQRNEWLSRFRTHGGEMRILASWYGERTPEWLPPNHWIHIRRPVMRQVVRYWAEHELELAAGALFAEFTRQYEVPNPDDWASDVEVLEIELEPSESQ